ncbi:MAG TPA: PAS domain S-box protein [Acidimicrobiales bacterium]|nr:PAS domain S-box protein [Acidimicrobiales bacterium]
MVDEATRGAGHVLVIDDDPDVALLARLQLELAGLRVTDAGSAEAGMAHARSGELDLVVLDWMLPDRDGMEVLRELRAEAATATVPVVMVTARSHQEDQRRAWEAGVAGYVTKPFDGTTLVGCIRDVLAASSEELEDRRRQALAQLSSREDPSGDRMAAVVEGAADAIATTSLEGVVLSWNPAAQALYGHTPADVVGRPVALLAGDAGADVVGEAVERVAGGEATPQVEVLHRRRDGTHVAVSVTVSPIRDAAGHITGASVVARDVTARRARESLFEGLLEAAPDAMVVVDDQGRIELANTQTEVLFGYTRAELLGRPIEVLVPEEHRAGHPGHRHRYFLEARTRPMGQGIDLAARRKDGSVFPAEISLSSIDTEGGRLVSAAIRDVSERKAAEARFRGLVDAAPDAMVIVDPDGRIELVNSQAEAMFGYERGELLDRPVETLVPPRFRGHHPAHREAYVAAPKVRPMGAGLELFAMRKDGSEFPVEISLSPLLSADRVSISAAIRDVSVRKRAEAVQAAAFEAEREATRQLREVDRIRSDFLSTVSHELRTPLTAIRGFADLLVAQWEATAPEQQRALVERIAAAGMRLDRLIEDLLDFTRLERGHLVMDVRAHELRDLVEDARRQLAVALEQHQVEVDVPAGLVALVDEKAIARVLSNLLTNAAKFSPLGSTIAITGAAEGDRVVLRVRDQGDGIPASEHERVFERFYRVGGGVAHRPGTGVGLAIVKEFTEAQGGSVSLSSTPGEGSEFTLRLRAARS